ncbi:MAG: hypothetical protein GX682_01520 [Clostridiaceae bacterium]|nr:hypothetical protein [Clostridiaceae bacterium]
MEITGEITDIIYQNEINSYTVAEFETQDGNITIVGYLPFINAGDTLKLIGKIVTHQDYGEQFKIDTFEKLMPQTLTSLEHYLSNGTIKGIGPATAKKIVDTFGEETIHVLKFEPEKLSNIKGINKEKAISISETFIENWELWQIVGYLEKFGIGVQNAKNVYEKLGINAIEEIEENPYILIDIANNVDFKKIDKMAMNLGMPYNYEKRIKSGIKYGIMCATTNGHCKVQKENLITFCKELLEISNEEVEENIIQLKAKNEIVEEDNWIYLSYFFDAENNIAQRIQILQNSQNTKKIENIKKEMKKTEQSSEIELSEKQKEAINAINENNVCIITGGPRNWKNNYYKNSNRII